MRVNPFVKKIIPKEFHGDVFDVLDDNIIYERLPFLVKECYLRLVQMGYEEHFDQTLIAKRPELFEAEFRRYLNVRYFDEGSTSASTSATTINSAELLLALEGSRTRTGQLKHLHRRAKALKQQSREPSIER